MTEQKPRIAVLADFLRDKPNELVTTAPNRKWLLAVTRHLAGRDFTLEDLGADREGRFHTDISKYMNAMDLPLGVEGWTRAWDSTPSDRFVQQLASDLGDVCLVVGWGLPNVVARALNQLSIPFLDFEWSPIRFCEDLSLDARTNLESLTKTNVWATEGCDFTPEAVSLVGWAAYQCPDSIPANAGKVGVIFGQTEVDAALVHNQELGTFGDFSDQIAEWAEEYDAVLFRPHPYASNHKAFNQLYRILPTIRPTLMNSYQLLASQRLAGVMALSSGIIEEAKYFGVPAKRLFEPKRMTGGFHYSNTVNLNILRGSVLRAAIAGQVDSEVPREKFRMRQQVQMGWGLPTAPVPSDFYSPPELLPPKVGSDSNLQAEPSRDEPRQVPSIYRRIIRETNRIAKQVKEVSSLFTDNQNSGATPETGEKDFGYTSGERQTAYYYYQIRRDHQARYEVAAKTIPMGASVLDAFCGNGYGSFLLSKGRRVLGIDGSADAIDVAKQHFALNGAAFESRQYPFDHTERYDAVVSYESVEHVDDGDAFFQFLVDLVKPGGMILYSTPNEDLLPFDPKVQIHHFRHYTLAETLGFATSRGMEIKSWFGQDVYRLDGENGIEMLDPSQMALREEIAGQFTVVVAQKPLG